jgi:hypothetical protein
MLGLVLDFTLRPLLLLFLGAGVCGCLSCQLVYQGRTITYLP